MIGEIVNADALEYMKSLDSGMFDLIIADPDYNDYKSLIKDGLIDECMRLLKDTGNILFFTKQPFDHELRNEIEPFFRREIVWTFTNGGAWCSNKMPLVSFQKIYWCIKSKKFFFNPRTGKAYSDKTRDFKRSSKVFGDWSDDGHKFTRSSEGVWLRDHLHYNKPHTGKIPAKPRELIEIFIRCFCPQGGVVLDPFAGTGIITQVADEYGCEVYASEIDADRCDKIINKIGETNESA